MFQTSLWVVSSFATDISPFNLSHVNNCSKMFKEENEPVFLRKAFTTLSWCSCSCKKMHNSHISVSQNGVNCTVGQTDAASEVQVRICQSYSRIFSALMCNLPNTKTNCLITGSLDNQPFIYFFFITEPTGTFNVKLTICIKFREIQCAGTLKPHGGSVTRSKHNIKAIICHFDCNSLLRKTKLNYAR